MALPTDAEARVFGTAVHALRLQHGISLNELARRAGVDPAYIHRIESRTIGRAPLPRRAVVVAIASALGLDRRQADQLLVQAGYAPEALAALGGWDPALADVAELLTAADVPAPAKAEFRELLRLLGQRWGRAGPG